MLRRKRRIAALYLFLRQQQSDEGNACYKQQQKLESRLLKAFWLRALGVVAGQLG
jgi:hypothetical protein